MSDFAVANLEDIDEAGDGRSAWRPIRERFGITSFAVSTWTGRAAGDRIIDEVDEMEREPGHLRAERLEDDAHEDLYLVHRGRARFELDGRNVDAPAGTFVFVPPGVRRTAFAEEPETTIVLVGGVPGKAYEPVGWEIWRPLHPLYESGRYEDVIARGRAQIEATRHPEPLFNLACCESLMGHTSDAIDHLRMALDSTEQYRERLRRLAANDPDFDAVRNEPAFKELIGD